MKWLIILLTLSVSLSDLNKISKINHYKNIGEEAYKQKDYKKAIEAYKTLADSLSVNEDPVLLNLANAYFNVKDTSNASYYYNRLLTSDNSTILSAAHAQLGVLKKQQNKLPEALAHFKNALKADPENADARYNYELLKKMMKDQQNKNKDQNKDQNKNEDQKKNDQQQNQQKNQQQNQQNKENQKQNQQNQQQQNQNQKQQQNSQDQKKQQQQQQQKQEQGKDQQKQDQAGQLQQQNTDEQGQKNQQSADTAEKLKKMNISQERAKMILEAMKNNEIQYIQQNERKPNKKPDSGKPDW